MYNHTVLCGLFKEFSRVILIISHRVANPLPKSIKDAVALQCGTRHFSEHSEGQAGRVKGSVLGAGRRTSSFIIQYLPRTRHWTKDKRTGQGLCLTEDIVQWRRPRHVCWSWSTALQSVLRINLGSAEGVPRAKRPTVLWRFGNTSQVWVCPLYMKKLTPWVAKWLPRASLLTRGTARALGPGILTCRALFWFYLWLYIFQSPKVIVFKKNSDALEWLYLL